MRSSTCRRCLAAAVLLLLIGSIGISATREPSSFTIVLLPDTQNYAESYPGTYLAQTRWIEREAGRENVKFVIHLGDIVQHADSREQWDVADRAHRVLDGVVPYSVLPGNHDMLDSAGRRDTSLYNEYFPPARFQKHAWYGGHLGETNDNNYCLFDASGMKFMVLSLEFNPAERVLQWANGVIESHKDHRVLVATHFYMRPTGRDKSCGENLWNSLIRKHPNIFMVVSGHVLGVHHQTSLNDAGGKVHEILSDYQGFSNGGDGWLQMLRFVPGEDKIHVRAYSPLLDRHNGDPKHSYTLDYQMGRRKLNKAG